MEGAFTSGMPWTVDEEEVKSIPWAARYLNCGTEATALCKNNRYAGSCWIDRDDVQPPSKQKAVPGGQASWHPGYRL